LKQTAVHRYGGFLFSVGGARVIGVLISTVTFPYLVRQLGVEMYGLWSYVVAVGAFLDCLADPGLTVYATQYIAARRREGFHVLPDVLALRFFCSLAAVLILMVIAMFEIRPEVRVLIRLYGLGLFAVNLLGSDYILGALEMFHARSILAVLQQALSAAGFFIFVHSPKDVLWLPISVFGSSALAGLTGWALLHRQGYRLTATFTPTKWRNILGPSSHYAVSSLMSNFYHRTGHLAVRWFLGDHALGIYAAAVRLVDLLRNFVVVVLSVLMPRMALEAKSGTQLPRLARFAVGVVALTSVPCAAGLISTAHMVVPWILGARYVEDISLLQWMAFYVISASAASLLAGTILYALGHHRSYLISTATGAAAGVLLYFILIPLFALEGAALAFVLAEVIVVVVAYSQLPVDLHGLWKNRMALVAIVASAVMVVAVRVVTKYSPHVLLVVASGAAVYMLASGWFVRKWIFEQLKPAS
jgi:O-antigen/teichoic acid export membrane protein